MRDGIYQLESGNTGDQRRYEKLLYDLDNGNCDGRRHMGLPGAQRQPLGKMEEAEKAILDTLTNSRYLTPAQIRGEIAHLPLSKKLISKAFANLRRNHFICRVPETNRLTLLSDNDREMLEVGAPIVFMPGFKSQRMGEIVEIKEVRNRPGTFAAVAALTTGETLFVSEYTAKVNESLVADEAHQKWLISTVRAAGREGISHNALAALAFKAEVPKITQLAKELIKAKAIQRVNVSRELKYKLNSEAA